MTELVVGQMLTPLSIPKWFWEKAGAREGESHADTPASNLSSGAGGDHEIRLAWSMEAPPSFELMTNRLLLEIVRREAAGLVEAMLRVELGRTEQLGEVSITASMTPGGKATPADALLRAAAMLDAKEADVVLWGGAHSDISTASIRALADAGRLFDAQHVDSVVPGECAAVVALVSPARAASMGPRATIEGAGGADTEATPANELPVSGDALAFAIQAAMATSSDEPAGWVISDTAYEALHVREWELVQVRLRAHLGVPYRWDALPQRIGRTGAAQLPLAAAVVAASFDVGHVPSPSILALGGTDAGRRSAVWMRAIAGSSGAAGG